PPLRAERWGLPLFCDDRLQRLDVECLLGDDVFQSAVLVLDLLQSLELAEFHPAVLGLPAVVGLLGDPVHATQVGDLPPRFALFDDRQDLLVGELAPFHRSSSERRASFYGVADFRGQVTSEQGWFSYPKLPLYWQDVGRAAFLIRASDKLAGFA